MFPVIGDMGNPQIVVDCGVARVDLVELGGGIVRRARPLVAFIGLDKGPRW